MGQGLPRIQAGEVVARRPVHERVGLQVHGIQWRAPPLPGQRLRLLSDEVRGCFNSVPISSGGGGEPSGGAQNGVDNVLEVWIEGRVD